jgi:hypothetical protein
MTTTLNASTAGAGGFIATSDNSGILALQTAGTTALSIDASQNIAFNSGFGSVATAYACRAWVNFDSSSGSSCAIRGSGNVSSVTYVSTGIYTVNFTNAMPDINYSMVGTGRIYNGYTNAGTIIGVSATNSGVGGMSTTSCRVSSINVTSGGAGSESNTPYVGVAFFR